MTDQSNEQSTKRDDPGSLAPLQIERLSVEDEAALMSRGKSGQLFVIVAAVAACAAVALFWLKDMDSHKAYADALASARSVNEQHAAAFLHCALPGVHASKISASEQLHSAIERYSERLGKSYGRSLAKCAPKLAALVAGLQELQAPADGGRLAAVRQAALQYQKAWDEYRRYLVDDPAPYDYVQALPRIEKIALAWKTYEQRLDELEDALRERL